MEPRGYDGCCCGGGTGCWSRCWGCEGGLHFRVDPSATMCRSLMRAGALRCGSVLTDIVQWGAVVKTVLMRGWEDAHMKAN